MDRVRPILFRIALAVLMLAAVAAVVQASVSFTGRTVVDEFIQEYAASDPSGQEKIAEAYLKKVPVADLMQSLEKEYSEGVCHVEAHPVGRALYKLEPNFTEAIRQCGGSCSYGCFHGVLMEMFATDSDTLGGVIEEQSPEEYLAHVKDEAKDLCTKPEVESVVRSRYCYHGLGHVFSYLNGTDLTGAVDSCSIFSDRLIAAACRSGVFMEYLLSTSSRAVYLTTDERPCDSFPDFKSSCYRYKAYGWIDAWGSVEQAFKGCAAFGVDELLCIRSVAQGASSRTIITSKRDFEKLCGSLEGDKRIVCIQGSLLRTIELNNGDDSDRICDPLEEPYRSYCVDYLHGYLVTAF